MERNEAGSGQAGRGGKARRLARLNSRISRLSDELETLQFMQDRLQRELEPSENNGGDASRRRLNRK